MNDAFTFLRSLTLDDLLTATAFLLLCLVGLYLHDYMREYVRKH